MVSSPLAQGSGLIVLALLPRVLLVLRTQFDGLYGQDAYAYYNYAREMFIALTHAQFPPPFWWPLGYPALLNMSFLLFGVSIGAAQWITVLAGAAVALVTFLLMREGIPGRIGELAGFVAGAIVALGGQMVQSSIAIMSDAPALMWATTSAWLLLRFRRTHSRIALALSAFTLALAVITRWENLTFALVWLVALLACLYTLNRQDTEVQSENKNLCSVVFARSWSYPLLLSFAVIAVVMLPQLAYKFVYRAPLAGQSWLEGWSPVNAGARIFDNVDGHFDYALPVALFYAQTFFHPAYLFPLLTPFLPIGAWLVTKRARADPSPAIVLLGWCALAYIFLVGIPYENFRFGLGFFVPVAALAAIGVAWVWDAVAPSSLRFALVVLMIAALLGSIVWEPRVLQPVLTQKRVELEQARWLTQQLPTSATVFSFGVNEALQTYSSLRVADLSAESPQTIAADARAAWPAYLFMDVENVESQWRGRPFKQIYNTLRDSVGLKKIGTIEDWTLFQIGAAP